MLSGLLSFGRRRRQSAQLAHKQTTTADLAMDNARALAAVAGPWAIAADYGMLPDLSLPEIAAGFASASYHGDDLVQSAAKAGAMEGFEHYLAEHPQDPYD
jgi:hypothetical protein